MRIARAGAALHLGAEAQEHLHVRIDLAHAERAALTSSSRRALPKRGSSGGTSIIDERISSGRRAGRVEVGAVVELSTPSSNRPRPTAQRLEEREDLAHVGDVGHAAQRDRLAR